MNSLWKAVLIGWVSLFGLSSVGCDTGNQLGDDAGIGDDTGVGEVGEDPTLGDDADLGEDAGVGEPAGETPDVEEEPVENPPPELEGEANP